MLRLLSLSFSFCLSLPLYPSLSFSPSPSSSFCSSILGNLCARYAALKKFNFHLWSAKFKWKKSYIFLTSLRMSYLFGLCHIRHSNWQFKCNNTLLSYSSDLVVSIAWAWRTSFVRCYSFGDIVFLFAVHINNVVFIYDRNFIIIDDLKLKLFWNYWARN